MEYAWFASSSFPAHTASPFQEQKIRSKVCVVHGWPEPGLAVNCICFHHLTSTTLLEPGPSHTQHFSPLTINSTRLPSIAIMSSFFRIPLEMRNEVYHELWLDSPRISITHMPSRTLCVAVYHEGQPQSPPDTDTGSFEVIERQAIRAGDEDKQEYSAETTFGFLKSTAPWLGVNRQFFEESLVQYNMNSFWKVESIARYGSQLTSPLSLAPSLRTACFVIPLRYVVGRYNFAAPTHNTPGVYFDAVTRSWIEHVARSIHEANEITRLRVDLLHGTSDESFGSRVPTVDLSNLKDLMAACTKLVKLEILLFPRFTTAVGEQYWPKCEILLKPIMAMITNVLGEAVDVDWDARNWLTGEGPSQRRVWEHVLVIERF